jgi:SAM-dependent methyltransferase
VSEFTGERVIPGEVDPDLWAEHLARYAFASRLASNFTSGPRALDAGCGTGYGCVELARVSPHVAGIDVSSDAIAYAREHSPTPHIHYACASVTAIPFAAAAFDLVTAFEVIEHLADWRLLLAETRRVLRPHGVLLVSTPNRLYYAESRALDGPNPYHVHEFEYDEFHAALSEFFPHVQILFQNRLESFAFHPANAAERAEARIDASSDDPAAAHFFLGACSIEPAPPLPAFVYVPRAANVLREREQHIRLLQAELDRVMADHAKLQELHEDLTAHLEEKNRWALELEQHWHAAQRRIVELQNEFQAEQVQSAAVAAGYASKVAALEAESREKTAWALDIEKRLGDELAVRAEEFAATVRLLDAAEATVVERTHWAQRLDAQLQQLEARLDMIRQSRWIRLGRTVGLGPQVDRE